MIEVTIRIVYLGECNVGGDGDEHEDDDDDDNTSAYERYGLLWEGWWWRLFDSITRRRDWIVCCWDWMIERRECEFVANLGDE